MLKFSDVPNIVIAGTLISFRPKPSGPPDSTEMSVDGYETEVMILLSKLRWSWTGWALMADIYRNKARTMLIIPWDQMPHWDAQTKQWKDGFNATAGATVLPKLTNGPVDSDKLKPAPMNEKNNTLVRYNPAMWTADQVAAMRFVARPADFKMAPGVVKDEILLHEMVHGLRQMEGTTDFHKPADAPHYDTVEEFMAIVVSNVYRSEMKRPGLRQDHWGFSPLAADLEDPKKFLDARAKNGESNLSRMKQFQKDNSDFFNDLKKVPSAFNPFKLM